MNIRSMPIQEAQQPVLCAVRPIPAPKPQHKALRDGSRYEARFCEFELSTRKFRVWDGGSLCTTCLRDGA